MNLFLHILPLFLRLSFGIPGLAFHDVELVQTHQLVVEQDVNEQRFEVYTSEPAVIQLIRKLETEEKGVEFFDLSFVQKFEESSFFILLESSLAYSDFRKNLNRPYLYDLFHTWKVDLG
jgi:hypothetical protein